MDTTDGHKETLPMLEEKQLVKEEKTKQVIDGTEFPDELEKIERETEQIKRMAKTKCYRKTELNGRNIVIQGTKEEKVELECTSSKTNHWFFLKLSLNYPWDINLPGDLQSFDINCLLKYNNYFNDNILNYVEHFLNQFSLHSKLEGYKIQRAIFDDLMVNILNTFNNATSLKYLNTYSDYLGFNSHCDCAFIYKKINIDIYNGYEALKDFVVCVGNLQSPNESLSKTSIIEEMLRNMRTILSVQRRKKIYGFLCNYLHIKFFYIEKDLDSNSY
ncbi:unnamed protein product, partial [Rotaria socialis]